MALTHGAFEYLIKPFSRQDLEDVVRRALGRRHAELGTRGQLAGWWRRCGGLAAKTRELEEDDAPREVEQSLRVTQLSILREISRTFVGQLDPSAIIDRGHRPAPERRSATRSWPSPPTRAGDGPAAIRAW